MLSGMNPLLWKREHQVALLLAAGLGCVIGAWFGVYRINPQHPPVWYPDYPGCVRGYDYHECTPLYPMYWLLVILCTILGGALAGMLIYIHRLLRT
jgi:hypothetical protein